MQSFMRLRQLPNWDKGKTSLPLVTVGSLLLALRGSMGLGEAESESITCLGYSTVKPSLLRVKFSESSTASRPLPEASKGVFRMSRLEALPPVIWYAVAIHSLTVFLAVLSAVVSTLVALMSEGLMFLDLAYSLTTASVKGVMLAVAEVPCMLPSQMEYILRPSLNVTDMMAGLLILETSMLNLPDASVTVVTVDGLASWKVTVELVKGAPVATVPPKRVLVAGVITGKVTGAVTGGVTGTVTGGVAGVVAGGVAGVVAGGVTGVVVAGVVAGVDPDAGGVTGVVNGVVKGVETGAGDGVVTAAGSGVATLLGAGVVAGAEFVFSKVGSGVAPPLPPPPPPPQPARMTVAAVMMACDKL